MSNKRRGRARARHRRFASPTAATTTTDATAATSTEQARPAPPEEAPPAPSAPDATPRALPPTAAGYRGVVTFRLREASRCTPRAHHAGSHPLDPATRVLAAVLAKAFQTPVTADDIAEHTGMTRTEVAHAIAALADDGAIDPGSDWNSITLCSPALLSALNLALIDLPMSTRPNITHPGHEQSAEALAAAFSGQVAPDEGADWSTAA